MENTDLNMHPDILVQVGAACATRLHNLLAIEAIYYLPDGSVYDWSQLHYGHVFRPQFTNGNEGQIHQERIFNQSGWEGVISADTLRNHALSLLRVYHTLAKRYPAMELDAYIASAFILGSLEQPKQLDLQAYMGLTAAGEYDPNLPGRGVGLITDHKRKYSTQDLLMIQHQATLEQAKSLLAAKTTRQMRDLIVSKYLGDHVLRLWNGLEQ